MNVTTLVLGTAAVVLAAVIAWAWIWPEERDGDGGIDYSGLADERDPAPRSTYRARDGEKLEYRPYSAGDSDVLMIILHGSATDSRYLAPFATALAKRNVAHVATPDIRGHGENPRRRGDVDDVEQLERDLADLIEHLHGEWGTNRAVVTGHSSGGGLAVRFAGGRHGDKADCYVLLAPYLGHDAPTTRSGSGGWADANVRRIIMIQMLEQLGITALSGAEVVRFRIGEKARDGFETDAYSYRMQSAMAPRDWQGDLGAIDQPIMLVAGADDRNMRSGEYETALDFHQGNHRVHLLESVGHLDVIQHAETTQRVTQFVRASCP